VQLAQGNSVEAEETNKKVTTLESKLNPQPLAPPPAEKPVEDAAKTEKPAAPSPETSEKNTPQASEVKTEVETN